MNNVRFSLAVALLAACGCAQQSSSLNPPLSPSFGSPGFRIAAKSKIQHVIIIVQENRTTNDLFNGLAGADTVRTGLNSHNQLVNLLPRPLTAPYDLSHRHAAFILSYAKGLMNGWDLILTTCKQVGKCPPQAVRAYGYVPEREVEPYYTMARWYAFANHMFQTNQGPSFPAHQYFLSGTSTISDGSSLLAAENPLTPQNKLTGGCDSPAGSYVSLIDPYGNESETAFPCFNRSSILELIEVAGLKWHYYQAHQGPGLWNGVDALAPIWSSPEYSSEVSYPPTKIFSDIDAGTLANVVWVTPTVKASDHAGWTDGSGPSWVASVVNKIGLSQYWNNTAIFLVWDDWGGWYDPVAPAQYSSYELGFRVPLIVISPYARQHYISTAQHEFGSILKFTEEVFGLPSLGTTDVRADDLADCFDFKRRSPRKFVTIPAPLRARYFLNQGATDTSPDTDF